jgi:hypothetical protein
MKRKLAVAVFSILSLVIPQFASAGQGPNYPGYNQNAYNSGEYVRTAPQGSRAYVEDRRSYGREWNHRDDRSYQNNYYGDNRYYGSGYDRGYYYDRDHHAGRSVAIIGGSAAAGAAIGAVTGQGKGAALGALIGGVGGLIADQAVRHHDRR